MENNETTVTKRIPQDEVRNVIRAFMEARGLSLVWLSRKLGYKNKQTVYNYMSSMNFTPGTLKRWSEILGYPYELLIEGKPFGGCERRTIDDRLIDIENRIRDIEDRLEKMDALLQKLSRG